VQFDGDFTHSRMSLWIPPDALVGRWTVVGATVTDSSGNIRSYTAGAGSPVPSGLGFDVTTGPIRPDAIRSQNYAYDATVRTAVSAPSVLAGGKAVLSGTVSFLGTPVPYPLVAIYSSTASARTLVGLVRGDRNGSFWRAMRVAVPTRYTAVFLGSDRGPRAPATVATSRLVGIGRAQQLAAAATTVHAPSGTVASLPVRLLPSRRGVLLRLQVLHGTRWVDAGSYRTDAAGRATARVAHPRSTTYLRWIVAGDSTHLSATSSVVRLLAR
jgi:hypothetical protein